MNLRTINWVSDFFDQLLYPASSRQRSAVDLLLGNAASIIASQASVRLPAAFSCFSNPAFLGSLFSGHGSSNGIIFAVTRLGSLTIPCLAVFSRGKIQRVEGSMQIDILCREISDEIFLSIVNFAEYGIQRYEIPCPVSRTEPLDTTNLLKSVML
ncbi:MAG TPA: hypothetical protein VH724_07375, partial [Candidatus Angelobacter sp.]|nr:hypothetical protein [Candidatus Angelobacter sp.]